jgi:peptidoglycan/LPS O-acetylase OafA/YrhL
VSPGCAAHGSPTEIRVKPVTIAPVDASRYRPDIDGLRAIAVLSVVLYHFGVKTFSGGFIGVDVFFVISGFLITRLILDAVGNDKFTYGNFYLRRVRRLLPAVLFTIAASFAMGWWMFSPQDLERLGGSALHGLLSIANFFFWQESGYFDADSAVKPLLHLWSLAVEEQFYFVWPLTLVLLCKLPLQRVVLPAAFIVFGFASWWFAEWFITVDRSGAFYLLPSRIVEFCLGAIMVPIVRWQLPGWLDGWLREVALFIGLVLIAYATLVFTKETPFPGTNALIPCVGTSLCIFGGSSRWLGALLRSRPMVFTGLISYSLYLCHWPIFVFYTYSTGAVELAGIETLGLTVLAYIIAIAMYRFIERPFRFGKPGADATLSSTRFALTCALLTLVMAYTSAHAWANKGWFWRFDSTRDVETVFDLEQLRVNTIDYYLEHMRSAVFQRARNRILVVGDSHARDVSNGLHQVLTDRKYEVLGQELDDACLKLIDPDSNEPIATDNPAEKSCAKEINEYRRSMKTTQADYIVYSAYLSPETVPHVERFVRLTQQTSRNKALKIIVMDRAVHFTKFHPQAVRRYANDESIEDINLSAAEVDRDPVFYKRLSDQFAEQDGFENVVVVSKRAYQCGQAHCDFLINNKTLAIWDNTHWTLPGARLFMRRLVEANPELFR